MIKEATVGNVHSDKWQRLRGNIWLTESWLRNEMKEFLEPYDVTLQQVNILKILRRANSEPLSTKEIAAQMIDKNSDVSRLVDRLVDKKLARKRKNPQDGRLVQVFINYEGLKLLAKIDDKMEDLDKEFFSLDREEIDQLNVLLEKIRA